MLPDLSGLSPQEAALITDVLSQLSIGNAPAVPIAPQSTPEHGTLQNSTLKELDSAAWGPCSQGLQAELFPPGQANSHLEGPITMPDICPPDGFYGAPQTPQNPYGADSSSGRWPHENDIRMRQPASVLELASGVPPSRSSHTSGTPYLSGQFGGPAYVAESAAVQQEIVDVHATSFHESRRAWGTRAAGQDSAVEEPIPHGKASPSSHASAAQLQPMSLLKEMREKLRQKQTQQASEGAAEPAASRASSTNGSAVFNMGLKAAAAAQAGQNPRLDVVPTAGGSTAVTAGSRTRRAPPSLHSSAAKAFTMLNARTNAERYGPEPGQGDSQGFTPTKPPVKLPEPERSARLQQLYERSAQWRRRCEERYAKERQDKETLELEGCTFTPKISTASYLIMQGKSPCEAYMTLSKAGTPTKHQRDFGVPDCRPSPSATTSSRTTPTHYRSTGGDSTNNGSPLGGVPLTNGKMWAGFRAMSTGASIQDEMSGVMSGVTGSVSPPRPVINGAEVGERLYQRALAQRARQEARIFRQLLEEERQRRFTASVQSVSPRVYDPPEPPAPRFLPTGMEECTFHPSSSSGLRSRPKSAPHMRGADGRSHILTSPLYNIYGPRGTSGNGRASSVNMGFCVSPDLDWEEFLARQDRFLLMREQKIAILEQSGHVGPRMCPGSRKLLREKELRQSTAGAENSTGVQEETSTRTGNSSPTPQDRRVRTIMEMYKECTFQPQITRKAAALPSRQLEDFVEGGRARRDEWRQQQQALKEMRDAEDLTFKPTTFTKDSYPHIRSRINLKNPDAYLALVADKRRQREALRAELDNEREAREMQQCTFKPQTTPLPAYLIRRLQEQHLEQLRADQAIAWEEITGGLGDIECNTVKGTEAYYVDAPHESPADFRHSMGTAGFAPEYQAAEAQDAKANAFRDAYQRALQYATTLGRSAV